MPYPSIYHIIVTAENFELRKFTALAVNHYRCLLNIAVLFVLLNDQISA
ncbi:unnamed protein product [Brugia timori]|uniref:Uncharacterized protein n=1 Tax=Brugia timori TaxID=42155 RepID=A0A3P7UVB2_9BILA|nr:unnamed protein product [Brugia timori]